MTDSAIVHMLERRRTAHHLSCHSFVLTLTITTTLVILEHKTSTRKNILLLTCQLTLVLNQNNCKNDDQWLNKPTLTSFNLQVKDNWIAIKSTFYEVLLRWLRLPGLLIEENTLLASTLILVTFLGYDTFHYHTELYSKESPWNWIQQGPSFLSWLLTLFFSQIIMKIVILWMVLSSQNERTSSTYYELSSVIL